MPIDMTSAGEMPITGTAGTITASPYPQPRPGQDVPVVDVPDTGNPDLPDPGGPGTTEPPVPGGDVPPSRPTDPDFA